MTNQWLISILEVSLTTSVIILTVKIFSPFINKQYAAKWRKWIWLIIAIRLLIPVGFSTSSAPIQVNIPNMNSLYAFSPVREKIQGENRSKEPGKEILPVMASDAPLQADGATYSATNTEEHVKFISWVDMAFFVWSVGCIGFIAYYIVGYLYFKKQVFRWRRIVTNPDMEHLLINICKDFNIKKQFNIYVCDKMVSPSLMGLIRPALVLPSECFSNEELTFIFRHELTHYRMYDLWYKMLLLLVNMMHWFNPLIYLLRYEAYSAMEFSCDEEVIKGMPVSKKKAYGQTILTCINQQKMRKAALTTCFNDNTKDLKERLKNILSTRKKSSGLIIILVTLLLTASIGSTIAFAFDGHKQNPGEKYSWHGAVNLISKNVEFPTDLIQNDKDWNRFLESNHKIALVAEIPEEDIYVYGLKENGKEKGTYTLRGIGIRQGKQIQVLDIFWGVYGDMPKLQYEDYDNDGIKELAMILRSANGTGIDLNELHVLERNNKDGWADCSFRTDDWAESINDNLTYSAKNGILSIAIRGQDTGERIDLNSLEKEWGDKLSSVSVGNVGEFSFKDGKIYLQVLPAGYVAKWPTAQVITDRYIQMEVLYNHGFSLKNDFAGKSYY